MFHKMRRKVQQLSQEETEAVLLRCSAGVLALTGDKAFPYAVPLSYVYDGAHIYFHSATEGHKIDAIQRNPNASFAVIDQDEVIPEKYTTAYRSVVVFGSALLARCNLWSDIDVYFECQSEPQRLPSIVSERQAFDKFSNFTVSEAFRRTILQDGVVVYER